MVYIKKLKQTNMNTIYLVHYSGGYYDDYFVDTIFATPDKSVAEKYVKKFNDMLNKWREYYSQFEIDEEGTRWIAPEHVEKKFARWNSIEYIHECYFTQIEVR
jgi:hypothetical protein